MYKEYINLLPFNESYEFCAPTLSVHNLIIGQPYIDVGGRGFAKLLG